MMYINRLSAKWLNSTFLPAGPHVRQHPHIGLATVTYLFSGAMMHRDSLGSVQRIEPGAINLMTAGKGIVHSERLPEDVRSQQIAVEGIQTWLALPTELEDGEPSFAHYPAHDIPALKRDGLQIKVLIGRVAEVESPVITASKTTFLDVSLCAGAEYQPDFPGQELAVYLVQGDLTINSEVLPEHHMAVLDNKALIKSDQGAVFILLGGEPLLGERFILWNFVASSREKLRDASLAWEQQKFALVPGELEFIPQPK